VPYFDIAPARALFCHDLADAIRHDLHIRERDRRYPVVDTERGIVLSIVRFGLKDGMKSESVATANDRLVAEFFAVKSGKIQEIQAVLFNLPDAKPTGWEPQFGPGRGGSQ